MKHQQPISSSTSLPRLQSRAGCFQPLLDAFGAELAQSLGSDLMAGRAVSSVRMLRSLPGCGQQPAHADFDL